MGVAVSEFVHSWTKLVNPNNWSESLCPNRLLDRKICIQDCRTEIVISTDCLSNLKFASYDPSSIVFLWILFFCMFTTPDMLLQHCVDNCIVELEFQVLRWCSHTFHTFGMAYMPFTYKVKTWTFYQ